MGGVNGYRFAIGIGLCVALLVLGGCQEPGKQSASSAPVASAPASASPVAQDTLLAALTAYQPPRTVSPLANCNLERVNNDLLGAQPLKLDTSHANIFTGWIDPSGATVPRFWLRFDDAQAKHYLHAPIQLTIARPDVLAADPNAPRISGFKLQLPANILPAGQYHVYIAVTSNSTVHVCDNGRHIEVEP